VAEFDVKTGHDTWVVEADPGKENPSGRFPAVRSGDELRILLWMPLELSQIRGRTILSATLSAPAHANWVSQTLSVQATSARWNVTRVNWSNKPAVSGAIATEPTGALSAGDRFEIDVADLVQAIADGDPNYGWQITTSQSTDRSTLRGFDSGFSSWVLAVDVSDELPQPSQLAPEGVIGTGTPTLLFDDVDDLAEAQVQIDATPSGTNADYDTGWVATTKPQIDMSDTFPLGTAAGVGDTTYNGLTNGATTSWRVRVKTTNGSISDWSDWVEITREDKPTLVMDNPAGTDLWDPTPTITAHLSPAGDSDTRWQVRVTSASDSAVTRYDSGDDIEGATLDHTIPLSHKGRKVFPTDGDYRLVVRAWDRTDRVPSPGDQPYVQQVVIVTLDVDGAVTAPTNLVATQLDTPTGYPEIVLTWERASDPDYFVVRRNGETILRLTPDDARISPGVFQWPDESAPPNAEHSYTVRAVTDVAGVRKQSANSNTETITAEVTGTWLRSDLGDLLLFGEYPEAEHVSKVQTFELPFRDEDVDLVTAVGGLKIAHAGTIDRRHDLPATLEMLEDLRQAPGAELRIVWSTFNVWVNLRGSLSYAPSKRSIKSNPIYDVKYRAQQIDPRD
jgi:hypothetical protein